MPADKRINLADEAAYNSLPADLRDAIDRWTGDIAGNHRYAPYLTMLFSSFVFQRLALDALERLIAEAEAPSALLEEHRMEVLRHLFLIMRDEAAAPVPPEYLINSVRLSAQEIVRELRRLAAAMPARTNFGLDVRDTPLAASCRALDVCGSFVLFKGDDAATQAALALLTAVVGKQRVPMYLLGDGGPFDRAFLAQGFLNVEVTPIDRWRSAGKDTAWLRKAMSGRRYDGITVVPRFLELFGGDPARVKKITATRLVRLTPVLRSARTSVTGCIPAESALMTDPANNVHIYNVKFIMPIMTGEADEARVKLAIDDVILPVPENINVPRFDQ